MADQLAASLYRGTTLDTVTVLKSQISGVVPMACAVGVCLGLTVEHLATRRPIWQWKHAALIVVSGLTLLDLCFKIVDAVHLMDNLHSLAAQYYFDWISITISYLLSSAVAYVCQWFFARRAWALWSDAKWIRLPILLLAHCSLIAQIIWVAWNARQPKLRSSLSAQEVQHVASWVKRFAPVKQGLQLTSGATGLVCITSLIVARLVRMKEFMVSKRLANRIIVLTMELPPMLTAAMYTGVRLCPVFTTTCRIGSGSWFRHTASLQSVFYWMALLWVLRHQAAMKAAQSDTLSGTMPTTPFSEAPAGSFFAGYPVLHSLRYAEGTASRQPTGIDKLDSLEPKPSQSKDNR